MQSRGGRYGSAFLSPMSFPCTTFGLIGRFGDENRRFAQGVPDLLAEPLEVLEAFLPVGEDIDGIPVEESAGFLCQPPDPHPLAGVRRPDLMHEEEPSHGRFKSN